MKNSQHKNQQRICETMRKTSINLYYNTNLDSKYKIDLIKKLGYDEFFTGVYDAHETMSAIDQINYAKSLGLRCTMLHCSYTEKDLNDFWFDNEVGDRVFDSYAEQIRTHRGLMDNFVVHLNGSFNSPLTEFGLERIRKLLDICEECETNLCIENLYSDEEIPYIFGQLQHPRLKICFDTGHQNFLTPNFNVLKDYGKFVTVLHIHDNHGTTDEHIVCGEGTINWEEFAKEMVNYPELVLSAEVKTNDRNKDTLITDQFEAFKKLNNLIAKYEN